MILRDLAATCAELARVVVALPRVEAGRSTRGPKPLVEEMRRRGRSGMIRDAPARARLRRVIGWVDAVLPPAPSCYRRALLEIGLDPEAAREPFTMGLCVGGTAARGHAWVGARGSSRDRYDVEIVL